jgi:sulfite exporter TauE/SafE
VTAEGHGSKERLREAAVAALLTHATYEEAAKAAGVGLSTLVRWLKDPAFAAAVREARRRTLEQALGALSAAAAEAVETLRGMLGAQSEAVRVRAAVAILEHAMRGAEVTDLEERIAALEAALAAKRA